MICNLGLNENGLGPSPKAVEAMEAALNMSNLYPDDSHLQLKQALAKRHGVPPEMIHITCGGSEFLSQIGRLFLAPGDEAIMAKPGFILYPEIARQTGSKLIEVKGKRYEHNLRKMADAITERTKVIWVVNPANPSGTYNNADEVDEFVRAVGDRCLIVFDEAYRDFVEVDDYPGTTKYLLEGRRVCIMCTFSKSYGLAGLRVGYGLADPGLLKYVPAVRMKYSVNRLGEIAALAAIGDEEFLEKSRAFVREAKEFYYRELGRLGLDYVPTHANFILLDTGVNSRVINDRLVRRGFRIRPGDNFGMRTHIRVTFGTPDENKRFIKALEEALGEGG
jgi:histidinol-phosphate aminotransferase